MSEIKVNCLFLIKGERKRKIEKNLRSLEMSDFRAPNKECKGTSRSTPHPNLKSLKSPLLIWNVLLFVHLYYDYFIQTKCLHLIVKTIKQINMSISSWAIIYYFYYWLLSIIGWIDLLLFERQCSITLRTQSYTSILLMNTNF